MAPLAQALLLPRIPPSANPADKAATAAMGDPLPRDDDWTTGPLPPGGLVRRPPSPPPSLRIAVAAFPRYAPGAQPAWMSVTPSAVLPHYVAGPLIEHGRRYGRWVYTFSPSLTNPLLRLTLDDLLHWVEGVVTGIRDMEFEMEEEQGA